MLQKCNPHLPTKDWKVVKVEEHQGDINQAMDMSDTEEADVTVVEVAAVDVNKTSAN